MFLYFSCFLPTLYSPCVPGELGVLYCSSRESDFLQRFQSGLSYDCSPLPQLTGCQIILAAFTAAAIQFNLRQSRGLQTACIGCVSVCIGAHARSWNTIVASRVLVLNEQAQTSEMSLRFKEHREHLKRAVHILCKCPTSCSVSFMFS